MQRAAMISARDYYDRVVIPTVGEFSSNNKDIRHALLACMATLHLVDYVMQNRELDPKKLTEWYLNFTRPRPPLTGISRFVSFAVLLSRRSIAGSPGDLLKVSTPGIT